VRKRGAQNTAEVTHIAPTPQHASWQPWVEQLPQELEVGKASTLSLTCTIANRLNRGQALTVNHHV
jgi:hypothetical protein